MKKWIYILLICLILPIEARATIGSNSSIPNVNIYFFTNECDKCIEEEEWLDSIYTKYYRLNTIKIKNNEKYFDILKKLKIPNNKYPLIVIGTNYFIGFNENIKTTVEEAITAYSNFNSYCDVMDTNLDLKECQKVNRKIYRRNSKFSIIKIISILSILGILLKIILEYRKRCDQK